MSDESEEPAAAPFEVAPVSARSRHPSELVEGDLVGGAYLIKRVIGQGGMGKIFDATDVILQRRVAVKVPFTREGSDALVHEARALAALEHPHLPLVHHVATHAGLHYLVMERLRGESLENHLQDRIGKKRPLGLTEALGLLTTVAASLHAIHHAGIVHRDIKPDNVMLVRDRGPVLIDFGLVMPQSNPGKTAMTSGSPYYASPEMISGAIGQTTGRQADLYSFGVMAYELFTGRPPFHAGDLQALLKMHLETPAPDVRLLRPDAPPELAQLIGELMHKEPGQRPESAEEVVWRLQGILKQSEQRRALLDDRVMIVTQLAPLAAELRTSVGHWAERASVHVFEHAEQALDALGEKHPRMLLVDMKVDGMSGVEFLMHVQGLELGSVIAALVVDLRPQDLQALRRMGVWCCLPIGKGLTDLLEPVVRNAFARGSTE